MDFSLIGLLHSPRPKMEKKMNWFKTRRRFIVALGALLITGCASTQEYELPFENKALFDTLDQNKDGKVSLDEFSSLPEDKNKIEDYFKRLDKNNDGFLTPDEFRDKATFEALDQNKDGKLSLDEFSSLWKDRTQVENSFKSFDKNNDGFLTREEFRMPLITIFRW